MNRRLGEPAGKVANTPSSGYPRLNMQIAAGPCDRPGKEPDYGLTLANERAFHAYI
jgi:hypothetical protein